jgi:transposase InsO family protein
MHRFTPSREIALFPTLDGFNDYYNYIREHQALEGQTPAQKAGISLNLGQNKWLGLLKKGVYNI